MKMKGYTPPPHTQIEHFNNLSYPEALGEHCFKYKTKGKVDAGISSTSFKIRGKKVKEL